MRAWRCPDPHPHPHPHQVIYGVFNGCGQQLSLDEFKRGLARLAVGIADEKEEDPLTPLLLLLPDRIEQANP